MMKVLIPLIAFGITLLGSCSSQAQNNMIPNPGFETCNSSSSIPGGSFSSSLSNWRMYVPCSGLGCKEWEQSHTQWILNSSVTQLIAYTVHSRNCSTSGQDRFILLSTEIHKEDALHGGDDYDCDRVGIDNIAVGLGQKFSKGTRYRIRYKVLPMPGTCTDDVLYDDCENAVSPSCKHKVNENNLRIFLSRKGPENWLDNNNDMEELISVNFFGTNPTGSSCHGWRVVDREFTPSHDYYTTLGFVTHSGSFLLDDVEVFPACDDNYLIQNKSYNSNADPGAFYRTNAIDGNSFVEWAGNYLTAGSNVGSNTGIGAVIVDNQSNITYKAGVTVTLKDNFSAKNGCFFRAAIEGCPQSRPANPNVSGTVGEKFKDLLPIDDAGIALTNDDAPVRLSVFPNPASSLLTVKCSLLNDGVKIRITNSINQVVGEYISTKGYNSYDINCGELALGIYFVSVYSVDGTIMGTIKIVKQ